MQHTFYALSALAPRDPSLWVFGSWSGQRFADNAAALFRYSSVASTDIQCIWITRNREILKNLRQLGYPAYDAVSPLGIWYSLRAGVYVFDGLTKDINHWTSSGAKRVLLRHGVGIKKIERAIDQPEHRLYKLFHGKWWERLMWTFLIPWHRVRPDLVIASSAAHGHQAQRFFDVPPERTAVTGMPRTDLLLGAVHSAKLPASIIAWVAESRSANRAIVLYLPTFRDDGSNSTIIDWSALDIQLAKTGARILFKPHPVDKSLRTGPWDGLNNILRLDAEVDPGGLLPLADCFVTDYSSVVFDYMLLRRPVIFFCPDLEQYQRFSRALDVPYEKFTPGRKVRNTEELVDAIEEATVAGKHSRPEHPDYERVLSYFHHHRDGKSSERVHNEIYTRFVARLKEAHSCQTINH